MAELTMMGIAALVCGAAAAELLDDVPLTIDPGEVEAHTVMISLPVPKHEAEALYKGSPDYAINGNPASAKPLAWWSRDEIPRRVLVYRASDGAIGDSARLRATPGSPAPESQKPWTVAYRPFKENPWTGYKTVLRGGTNAESMSEWDDLVLEYRGKEITLRMGTRRDKFHESAAFAGHHDWWQWVRVESLWDSADVQLFRVGGLLYNEDSFLHCDLYLELYANGVARAFAHFVNSRVIGDGWEYFGIPVIAIGSPNAVDVDNVLDGSETRFDIGGVALDIRDSADLIGEEHPGRLYRAEEQVVYQPWEDQRVTDKAQSYGEPFVTRIGDATMLRGLARTVRFTFSVSEAPPRVAQLVAPAWLHAEAKELFPQTYLPVRWRLGHTPPEIARNIAAPDMRYHGTFEGGYSDAASEGTGGLVMMYGSYYAEDPHLLRRGLAWSYNWADIMVDHIDWSIRQVFTGYYWKTSTYSKFADITSGWLETGDPYLLETAEHTADAYWAIIRSTWPARSMGRGILPVQDMIMLYKYTRNPVYFERALEIIEKSIVTYSDPDQFPGHNIGVGPNGIGNWVDYSIVGFAELSLARAVIDAAQTDTDLIDNAERERLLRHAESVVRYVLTALEAKGENDPGGWRHYETGMLIITALPLAIERSQQDLAATLEALLAADEEYQSSSAAGRPYHAIVGRPLYDAATLNAKWKDGTLVIDPRWLPDTADGRTAEIDTPAGTVTLKMQRKNGEWNFKTTGKTKVDVRVVRSDTGDAQPPAPAYKPGAA
jgi:hypothetical protein